MEHEQHEPAAGEDEPNPPEEQDDAEKQGSGISLSFTELKNRKLRKSI